MVTDPERMEAVLREPGDPADQQEDHRRYRRSCRPSRWPSAPTGHWSCWPRTSTGPALQLLVGGNMHKTMQSVVVRAPGFGHRRVAELEDLAVALGGHVIAKDTGIELSEVSLEHLGSCDRITVTENETTIVGGARRAATRRRSRGPTRGADRARHASTLTGRASSSRIARLTGRVAVIRVGGATSVELKERMLRVEDALAATRAAMEAGIVSGGGTALAQAHRALADLDLTGDEADRYPGGAPGAGRAAALDRDQRRVRRRRRRADRRQTSRSGTDSTPSQASTATCSTRV